MPPRWQEARKMKKKPKGAAKTYSQDPKKVIPYGIPKEEVWMSDLKKAADYSGQLPRKTPVKIS
jgi:hypothetical protein